MIPVPLLMALALFSATAPFSTDMHLPALPAIAAEFGAPSSLVQMTLSGFFLGMGFGQLVIGPVSDVVGRKRLLIAGSLLAMLAAASAALAPSIGVLIAARTIQGFGGGACVVLSRAIIPDLAHGDAAARAFSLMMAIQGIAPALAPVLGGIMAEPVGWRGIHWFLCGMHLFQLFIAVFYMPETREPQKVGSARAFAGAIARNYLTVLKHKVFWGFLIAMALSFGTLFSYISASAFVIQDQMGFGPVGYSLIFAVNSLGLFMASIVNAKVVGRVGAVNMLRLGMAMSVAASLFMLIVVLSGGPWWLLLLNMFLIAVPTPIIMGNSTALGTGLLRQLSGSASAVMGFVQSIIAAFVSPVVGLPDNPAMGMALGTVVCSLIAALGMLYATRATAGPR